MQDIGDIGDLGNSATTPPHGSFRRQSTVTSRTSVDTTRSNDSYDIRSTTSSDNLKVAETTSSTTSSSLRKKCKLKSRKCKKCKLGNLRCSHLLQESFDNIFETGNMAQSLMWFWVFKFRENEMLLYFILPSCLIMAAVDLVLFI